MNIRDAVIQALEKDCYITREDFKGIAKIKPTNGNGNCILMNDDGGNPSKYGWQPTAKELIATDWILTE